MTNIYLFAINNNKKIINENIVRADKNTMFNIVRKLHYAKFSLKIHLIVKQINVLIIYKMFPSCKIQNIC